MPNYLSKHLFRHLSKVLFSYPYTYFPIGTLAYLATGPESRSGVVLDEEHWFYNINDADVYCSRHSVIFNTGSLSAYHRVKGPPTLLKSMCADSKRNHHRCVCDHSITNIWNLLLVSRQTSCLGALKIRNGQGGCFSKNDDLIDAQMYKRAISSVM